MVEIEHSTQSSDLAFGNLLSFETAQSIATDQPATYSVQITDNDGVASVSFSLDNLAGSLGIDDIESVPQLKTSILEAIAFSLQIDIGRLQIMEVREGSIIFTIAIKASGEATSSNELEELLTNFKNQISQPDSKLRQSMD